MTKFHTVDEFGGTMYWIYRIFKDKGVRQRSSCITRQIQLLDVLFVEPLAHIGTEKEVSPLPLAQLVTWLALIGKGRGCGY